jgi:predicted O-methyltransferase YrrM
MAVPSSEILKHIYQSECFGEQWFTDPSVYSLMVNNCRPTGTLVELGAWKGRSSAFLVVEAKNKNEDIEVHIVDTWKGSQEHSEEMKDGLYEKFISNMAPLNGLYTAHRMNTNEASKLFDDSSLDGVFIDADHSYEAVKQDISNWMPKVRSGGILAGHDYTSTFSGVVRAVNESIQSFTIHGQCWVKIC